MERLEPQPEEHQKEPPLTSSNDPFDRAIRVVREEIARAEAARLNRQLSLDSALGLHDTLERHYEVVEQVRAQIAEATSRSQSRSIGTNNTLDPSI